MVLSMSTIDTLEICSGCCGRNGLGCNQQLQPPAAAAACLSRSETWSMPRLLYGHSLVCCRKGKGVRGVLRIACERATHRLGVHYTSLVRIRCGCECERHAHLIPASSSSLFLSLSLSNCGPPSSPARARRPPVLQTKRSRSTETQNGTPFTTFTGTIRGGRRATHR